MSESNSNVVWSHLELDSDGHSVDHVMVWLMNQQLLQQRYREVLQVDRLSSLPTDVLRHLCRMLSTPETSNQPNPDPDRMPHHAAVKSTNTTAFQALRSCCKRLASVSDEIRRSILCNHSLLYTAGPFLRKLPHLMSVSVGFKPTKVPTLQSTNVSDNLSYLHSILPGLTSLDLHGDVQTLIEGFPNLQGTCNLEDVDRALVLWNKTLRQLDLSNMSCVYNASRPNCGLAFLSQMTALRALRMHEMTPIINTWELSRCTGLLKLHLSVGSGGRRGSYLDLDVSVLPLLQELFCANFKFKSLCVRGLKRLQLLNCTTNTIPVIDVSTCPALRELRCEDNPLDALELSACHKLVYLACGSCSGDSTTLLSNLCLYGCTQLKDLHCSKLCMALLELSPCTSLQCVRMKLCTVHTLDLAGVSHLKTLDLPESQFTLLNTSGCTSLVELRFGGCTALAVLSLYGCSMLEILDLGGCTGLQSLDLNGCTSLQILSCPGCPLHFLDLGSCVSLVALTCSQTYIRSLDVSPAAQTLRSVLCSGCRGLRVLCAKGCWRLATLFFDGCPVQKVDVEGCRALMGCAVSSSGRLQGAAHLLPA